MCERVPWRGTAILDMGAREGICKKVISKLQPAKGERAHLRRSASQNDGINTMGKSAGDPGFVVSHFVSFC